MWQQEDVKQCTVESKKQKVVEKKRERERGIEVSADILIDGRSHLLAMDGGLIVFVCSFLFILQVPASDVDACERTA